MILTFHVHKSPELIFEYLSDADKFATVHPVIDKITLQENHLYKVYETMKLGFIPVSFTYTATIDADRNKHTIHMQVTVMKFTRIDMYYQIKPAGLYADVEEQIHIRSPFPIKSLMKKIFSKQHAELFKNIGQLP